MSNPSSEVGDDRNRNSHLLSCNLSNHVFSQQILSFLDRPSILQIMHVTELRHHFELASYYCQEHGTPLDVVHDNLDENNENDDYHEEDDEVADEESPRQEKIKEPRETDIDEDGKEDDKAKKEDGNEEDIKGREERGDKEADQEESKEEYNEETGNHPPRLKCNQFCEDCVEEELGNKRCPKCDEFSDADDVHVCKRCSDSNCEYCTSPNRVDFDFCSVCENHICEKCNPNMPWCGGCDFTTCEECQNNGNDRSFRYCRVCEYNHGCEECDWGESYDCHECNATFCFDCRDHFICEACYGWHCKTCKEFRSCEDCMECFCLECDDDSFNCGECQKSFCFGCKEFFYCMLCDVFYCQSCKNQGSGEDICASCHGENGPMRCEECRKWSPDNEVLTCSECETVACSKCTKTYACDECSKKICADCQDVFQRCCCKKKGTFRLVKKITTSS